MVMMELFLIILCHDASKQPTNEIPTKYRHISRDYQTSIRHDVRHEQQCEHFLQSASQTERFGTTAQLPAIYFPNITPTTGKVIIVPVWVFHGKWNNERVVGERAPLSSTKLGVGVRLVARIQGSPPPVGGRVRWPVCGWEEEKGEAEHECWSKFSQVPAAFQINPPTTGRSVPALFQ